jgi:ATP-binding cassette subfamily B protein
VLYRTQCLYLLYSGDALEGHKIVKAVPDQYTVKDLKTVSLPAGKPHQDLNLLLGARTLNGSGYAPGKGTPDSKGNIRIENLSFSYNDDARIFDNISFNLRQGETLAIVGRTGVGKSTIIDLLVRVYNPPKNTIFLDGHEIYTIPLSTLRSSLVMVPQDIFLFSDTIAGNISLSKPDASREEIENAAKIAQVYKDIIDFEKGFDTVVGERGVTLSGGQKQRIAIARALLANPNILILDDSLSAVDTKTESMILEHLVKTRKEKTTIIIAHRISSLQHADKIIVLENEKIAETGNHQELLAKGGLYHDLFEKQQIEERINQIELIFKGNKKVRAIGFTGLVVDLAKEEETNVLLRGLRAVSDFEYEFQLANMNRAMSPDLESVFLTPKAKFSFLSSTLVREIASMGGELSAFVDPIVEEALKKRFKD